MRSVVAMVTVVPLLAACTTNSVTGEAELDAVLALELIALTGAILNDPDPIDVDELGADGVVAGIERFCQLDPWDKSAVRRQLDERDPALRPYLIARYGGEDGDVCSEA